MWILFLIIITSPGQFRVEVLETYKTPTAEVECKSEKTRISLDFLQTYKQANDQNSYGLVCLKQPDKEA